MKNVGNSSRGRSQGVPQIQGPMYMAHRAVIFATAQLSCQYFSLVIDSHCFMCVCHIFIKGFTYLYTYLLT